MINEDEIIELIKHQGILPLFYNDDKQVCVEIAKALYKVGVRVIEFTNRGINAVENCKALVQMRNDELTDLIIGVGTICNAKEANVFIDADADFLISPVFDLEIFDATYMAKKLWIPGCMTPTEIHMAKGVGCSLVKVFPGNVVGAGFIKAVKDIFPSILFMPTGGVALSKESIGEWFDAGAVAVGMGSQLISKELMQQKDYAKIGALTSEALDIVKASKH